MTSEDPELEVLLTQLGELLAEGVDDAEDAFEIAVIAGLAARSGATALDEAVAWRDGPGADLLDEAFSELDLDGMLEALDALTGEEDPEDVEEAVADFDDAVAAAVWCGRGDRLLEASRVVTGIVQALPDPFATIGDAASQMLRLPAVAREPALYGYWQAIAEAATWADSDA